MAEPTGDGGFGCWALIILALCLWGSCDSVARMEKRVNELESKVKQLEAKKEVRK